MAIKKQPNYRLSGINPLAYMGVEPYTPPDLTIKSMNPTVNDSNFNIGTIWTTRNPAPITIWMLVDLNQGVARWVQLYPGGGGGGASSFPTDSGMATQVGGILNVFGTSPITTSGSGNTVTVSLENGSNGQVIIGGGAAPAWANITAGAGITITNGANSITIAASGSGNVQITPDSGTVVIGPNITLTGGTSGAKFVGSAGTTLTESFQFLDIAADSSATTGYVAIDGSKFLWAGPTGLADVNTFVGEFSGNDTLSGSGNTGVGNLSLTGLTSGSSNTSVGTTALSTATSGNSNNAFGFKALEKITIGSLNSSFGYSAGSSFTSGSYNTALGSEVLSNALTSTYNVALGMTSSTTGSGNAYTGAESSNILIANDGVNGENNVIRIGKSGSLSAQQNKCFIAGIDGVNVGSVARVVTEASDQLGTAVITAGTGITVTPSANTITIAATGVAPNTGLIFIESQTVTGVTEVDFTTGITPTYNNYYIIGDSITSAAFSSDRMLIQLSTNGGVSYITTGYLPATTGLSTGPSNLPSGTSVTTISGNILNVTAGTGYVMYNGSYTYIAGASVSSNPGSGVYTTANIVVDALRLVTASGVAFDGSFSLYGYSK